MFNTQDHSQVQLPSKLDDLLKLRRMVHSKKYLDSKILHMIISDYYPFYYRSLLLFRFTQDLNQTFDALFGKDTIENIQKTQEYFTLYDSILNGTFTDAVDMRQGTLPHDVSICDPMLIGLAERHVKFYKAVEDYSQEMNAQIKCIESIFFLSDFLDSYFSKKLK
jgi:hypothetical protein